MAWDDILNDPEFQGQDQTTKTRVAENYFSQNFGQDPEYQAQTPDIQERVRSNFLSTLGTPPEQEFRQPSARGVPGRTILGTAKDIGISALSGAIGLPESLVGLADIPTGGRVGEFLESVGFRPAEARRILEEELSPAQKEAGRKVAEAEGFFPTIKEAIKSPSVIARTAIESAPSILGGAGLARGVLAFAPKISPIVAGAIGEGAISAGAAAEQIRTEGETGRLEPRQAAAAVVSGAITGIIGVAGGRLAQKFGVTDVDTFLAQAGSKFSEKGVVRRLLEGGISEGLFEELPQSAQEQVWMNAAQDKPLLEGVDKQAAIGLLTGAAVGSGINILRAAPKAAEKADIPEVQALPKEVAERIVADQTISGKTAKDVATYFANELPPTKSAEESAKVMDDLLNEAGIGVTTEEVQDVKARLTRGEIIGEEAVEPIDIDEIRLDAALKTPPFQRTAEDRLAIRDAMKQDVDIDIASVFTGRDELRAPTSPIDTMTESLETKLEARINTIEPKTDLGNEILETIKEETVRAKVEPIIEEPVAAPEVVPEIPTIAEEALLPEAVQPVIPEEVALVEEEIPTTALPFELKVEGGVAVTEDANRQILENIKTEVEAGEAGRRIPIVNEFGETLGVETEGSSFPEYFQDKGYRKKPALIALNRALTGKKLAPKQELLVKDLHDSFIQARPEAIDVLQADIEERPAIAPEPTEKAAELPFKRARIGKSPQPHKVLGELEATPEEIELGERFFEVENEKTGEVSTVAFEDIKPIKEIITEEMRDKAAKNIKSKLGRLTAGVDPTLLKDYAVIGAFHFERGLRTFSAWGKKMIEEFGDGIKPHLNDLWKQAKTQVPKEAEVIPSEAPAKAPAKKVAEAKKPEVKAPAKKPVKKSRIEELQKKFEKDLSKPTMDETLELAEEEKQLPKKKFGDHRDYIEKQKAALSKMGIKPENRSVFTKINELRENLGTNIRQKLVDQYASLKGVSEQGYILAIMSNTATGALEAAFQHGKLRLTKDGAITVDETGKGLANALAPLGVELDDFLGWVAGNRAKSLKGQDRERLFSDEDIEALISLSDGKMEDGRHRKAVYNKALRDLNAFQKSMVDIAVETGTINKEEAESWNKDFYVPFYRVLEEAEGVKGPRTLDALAGQTAITRLKGADVPLNDILQNILMNWNHLINSSLKNQAGVVSMEAAEKMGSATQIKKRDKTKNSVFVRKDGKQVWYDVHDPLILESISALSWEGFESRLMKMMRKFKRALTLGVTISPEFRIANLMRDTIHSVAVGKLKYNMFDNVFGKGWSGTKKDSLVRARMLAGGGEIHFGHLYGTDPEGSKLLIQKGIKKETILDNPTDLKRFTGIFHKAWDSWNEVGSRLENINRAALYQNRVKEVGELRANFEARDLMNFTNSGAASSVRFLTQVVPFLNARMQGLDKMGRAFADKEQRAQFVALSSGVALSSIALYLAFKDDDDFKEREQWDRDTYWWFKLPGSDIAYRIPKPFEVGAIGTMAERMVEQIADDEVHGKLFAERFAHMVAETFSFSIVPQMIQPTLDIYANKNPFTKRPIETIGLQRLSPKERKRAWTSETAIGLSEAMDKVSWGKVVLSPIQVEHLVQGYLGWLGAASLATVDQIFTRPIGDFPVEPTRRIDDYPAIGRFVRSNPQRNTKYATLFYEQLQEMNEAHNDIQNFRKLGELEKAKKLRESKKGQLKLRKYFNAVQRKLSKVNRRLQKVHANRELTAQEKRNEIDLLTVQKNRLVRIAAEKAKFVK